jgi:pimeloyl-ACP methyl ester carboxylesterase
MILAMFFANTLSAQTKDKNDMKQETINTSIGNIAVYQKIVPNTIPIIFLHGVYYDNNLWNYYTSRITDRTVITLDMPHHGKSKDITKKNWTMEDCANMLNEIIDHLKHKEVYAIGHSWGSMTILRASIKKPEKFKTVGLCNMPYDKGTFGKQLIFGFQHLLLPFRKFYTKQVAKAMFSTDNRKVKPEIAEYFEVSMSLLTNEEVRKTDKAVITKVDDGNKYLDCLKVSAFALKGSKDYVGTPKNMEITVVEGAHTSPLEQPEMVFEFINKVIEK